MSNSVLIRDLDKVPEPTDPVQPGQDVYFEVLELQPIILSVSFVRNIASSGDDTQMYVPTVWMGRLREVNACQLLE